MKRILVPHDSSKLANLAFEKAVNLCAKLNSELFLLTVIGPRNRTTGMSWSQAKEALDNVDAKAQSFLVQLKKSAIKKMLR